MSDIVSPPPKRVERPEVIAVIRIPAKVYIVIMLVAGVVTFFYGIGTGDAKTILGSFLFIGIAGGAYLLTKPRNLVSSISPSGRENGGPEPKISDTPYAQQLVTTESATCVPSARQLQAIESVGRRFPGVIPGGGTQICKLALEISRRLANIYSLLCFHDGLISTAHIDLKFPPRWTKELALSRYYSLGLICLTHCARLKVWSDALTVQGGMQVYDAALELAWSWESWTVPLTVTENTLQFMRQNIHGIAVSLDELIDQRARTIWFSRYAERLVRGSDLPWNILDAQPWRNLAAPELLFNGFELELGRTLQTQFEDAGTSILNLVICAERGQIASNLPGIGSAQGLGSIWPAAAVQPAIPSSQTIAQPVQPRLTELLDDALPGRWVVVKRRERTNVYPSPQPGFEVQTPLGYRFRQEYGEGYERRHGAHSRQFDNAEAVQRLSENIKSAVEECPEDCACRRERIAGTEGPCCIPRSTS